MAARGRQGHDAQRRNITRVRVTFSEDTLREVDTFVQRTDRGERLPSEEELRGAPAIGIALAKVACRLMRHTALRERRRRGRKRLRGATGEGTRHTGPAESEGGDGRRTRARASRRAGRVLGNLDDGEAQGNEQRSNKTGAREPALGDTNTDILDGR